LQESGNETDAGLSSELIITLHKLDPKWKTRPEIDALIRDAAELMSSTSPRSASHGEALLQQLRPLGSRGELVAGAMPASSQNSRQAGASHLRAAREQLRPQQRSNRKSD
jgi:hypothetical protein